MASYRDLIVWQKSMDLVVEVYKLAEKLPKQEAYGLSDQMRRAAVSIPSNIAEGHGRNSKNDFIRFLSIAQGSRAELETQMDICVRLNFLTTEEIAAMEDLATQIIKMIVSMQNNL